SRAEPNGQRRQAGSYRDDPTVVSAERDEAADAWIDVQLIARRTAAVGPLIYYPTIAMLLLMFARSSLFDGWHWPPGLIWVLAASTAVLVLCYVVLRREAE